MRWKGPAFSSRAAVTAGILVVLLTHGSASRAEPPSVPRPRPAAPGEAALAPEPPPRLAVGVTETANEAPLPRRRPSPNAAAEAAPGAAPPAAASQNEEPAVSPGRRTSIAGDLTPPKLDAAAGALANVTPPPAEGASGPASAVAAIDVLARTPRSRPSGPPPGALALVDPRAAEPLEDAPLAPPIPAALSSNDDACMKRIGALGVKFETMPPIDLGGACPVAAPLKVASLGSGVTVAPEATMNCRTAEAVALWVKDVLVPQAKLHLSAVPTRIVPGSTYACRPRNNQRGARLSEHAQANAFDVMGIIFADRPPLDIAPRGTAEPEGRFQAEIRQRSCAHFTTVLGPGSDASHANHLHFDLAQRRGGYRLCSLGEPRIAGRAPETGKLQAAKLEASRPERRRRPGPIAGPKPGL